MRLPQNDQGGAGQGGGNNGGPGCGGPDFNMTSSNGSGGEPDFSEFMWMAEEDIEAFDRKVLTEIEQHMALRVGHILRDEEEEFLQRMLEEEEARDTTFYYQRVQQRTSANSLDGVASQMQQMQVQDDVVSKSTLNPYAAEFVPGQHQSNGSNSKP
ncbi:polyA-binding protein interacting protein 2 isoform X2 [Oratosquilla oratoria]|uniref:polyA-binding protein interacting protein 2 isoform X2 n=1 Tax=Oratosquilla oratoria TaxID=337810 RepID=UPI003F757236